MLFSYGIKNRKNPASQTTPGSILMILVGAAGLEPATN